MSFYKVLLPLFLLVSLLCPCQQAHAQLISCPCGPIGGGAKVKDTINTTKGDKFVLKCTNAHATGDFVWEFFPAGGGAAKQVGRCVYPRGFNTKSFTFKGVHPNRNIKQFIHICIDRNNLKRAVMNVFQKNTCKKLRYSLKKNNDTGEWEETPLSLLERQFLDVADFDALSPDDLDGDGVPDEGFELLLDGINPPPDPHAPALGEFGVGLLSNFDGVNVTITWDIPWADLIPAPAIPILTPGDQVEILNITAADLVSVAAGFKVTELFAPPGIRFTAVAPVVMNPGQVLAQVTPQNLAGQFYSISDEGAEVFYDALFTQHEADPTVPIQDILGGLSSQLDFSDMPGYGSAAGHLNLKACALDTNGDGAINVLDLIELLLNFGVVCPEPCPLFCAGDLNEDCVVNVLDLIDLLLAFGTACP